MSNKSMDANAVLNKDDYDKMSSSFLVGLPCLDWVTATTYEGTAWMFWTRKLDAYGKHPVELKIMQYDGHLYRFDNGTAWVGAATIKGKDHLMLRLSGDVAEQMFPDMCSMGIREGWLKITRIDLQVTVDTGYDEWSQWRAFNRLKKAGKNVSMLSSRSGVNGRELSTVYIGSRTSERFTRLYEKEDDAGNCWLRWETEYKGGRARMIGKHFATEDTPEISSRLLHEVQATNDDRTIALFSPYLGDRAYSDKVNRVASTNTTERWLLKSCLPAFEREVNKHESNGRLREAFLSACLKSLGYDSIQKFEDKIE